MEARLQRRVQRYGWDLAADAYEPLWRRQLSGVHAALMALARLSSGEQVLDVACGSGWVTLEAARRVGTQGRVEGVDLSGAMVERARQLARQAGLQGLSFARMDAEALEFAPGSFDVVLCSLGLMYVPDAARAIRDMRRVLRPGGRLVLAVWGERRHCGWAPLFEIVQHEVASEVCPLFFQLGQPDALAQLCRHAGCQGIEQRLVGGTLDYADGEEACGAAFAGGPVAMAWSRFDAATRARVCHRYLDAIARWRQGDGYAVPAQFTVVAASA